MKISVKGDRRIGFTIPSGLLLNPLCASMLPKFFEEQGITISGSQARALVRALNHYRKTHPDWVLVEVQSAQGEAIQIKL